MLSQVLLSLLLYCTFSLGDACEDSKTISMAITSRRNLTGHQLIQLQMLRKGGAEDTKEVVPWRMDVEQGDMSCDGQTSKYVSITVVAPTELGAGYEFHPLVGRYKLHTTAYSWTEAYNICQQEGAHLAVINSDTEAHVLVELLKRNDKPLAYVGVNDIVTEGTFVTIFGEELSKTGYSKWSSNEPTNTGGSATHPGEDCVLFYRDTALYNDVPCSNQYPFICELELH